LSDQKVENPEDVVKVGDELEVKILRVDTEDRKIGLSRRRVEWNEEKEAAENAREQAAAATRTDPSDLKGGLGASGPLISAELGNNDSGNSGQDD
jgi:small subunit ribosomal protein S1